MADSSETQPRATPGAREDADTVRVDRRQLLEIIRRARWIDRVAGALLASLEEGEREDERRRGP